MKDIAHFTRKNKRGRKSDLPNTETVRTGIKIPTSTYDKMKVALATTHKDIKTQNMFINAAILSFLDDAGMDSGGFSIVCESCGDGAIKKSPTAKYCSSQCRTEAFYKRKYTP